jgi:hypothetical protein
MTERLPLGPEERALADRLARLGPHGEPSPALDARILAAARAELEPGPVRRPVRWPLALGVAASLMLAVGVAWQLRPMPEAVTYDEATSAMVLEAPATGSATEDAPSAPVPAEPDVAPQFDPPAPGAVTDAPTRTAPSGTVPAAPAPASARQARRAEPQVELQKPAVRPLPPSPEAPAAAAPASDSAAAADMALPAPPPPAPAAVRQEAPRPFAAPTPARERAANADAQHRKAAMSSAAAGASNESFAEDVPPATADSPAVRDAWLQRIRELQAAGRTDEARASLREFALRYPDDPLPDDLRPLLD